MQKKNILIVDDDSRNIFALTAVLRSRSFECLSCQSAREALTLLESDKAVDIVLLDMMMPDMDGYEALPLIKRLENREDVPVIAVTAQAMVGDREKCLAAGADGYISKPVDIDKLLELLNNV
ncbi:MAG: response regulator [Flavobacterium sp.]|uniref:response regulator n=1 Tax=Flavobacterium sp. TaxID=239 RepID=UPI0012245F9F|nr:response regulator [Flavobacterium sp.]RZJ67475.1 MAG: response regulator [Flavobacterium sp.]